MRLTFLSSALCYLFILNSSCATLSMVTGIGFKKPVVKITGVSIGKFNLTEIPVQLEVEISNSNSYDIQLQNIEYNLQDLQQNSIATGSLRERISLKPNSKQIISTKISIKPAALLKSAQHLMSTGIKDFDKNFKIVSSAEIITFVGAVKIENKT
jgi:LEA14-like dessication related protein